MQIQDKSDKNKNAESISKGSNTNQDDNVPYDISTINSLSSVQYSEKVLNDLFNNLTKNNINISKPLAVFNKIQKASQTIPNFDVLLTHPLTDSKKRNDFITKICTHFGADTITIEFIKKLLEHNRYDLLNNTIVPKYTILANKKLQRKTAIITSAEPLESNIISQIEKKLTSHIPKGYTLEIIKKVNPSLIAGFTVEMDDLRQDLSLSTYTSNLDKVIHNMVNEAILASK